MNPKQLIAAFIVGSSVASAVASAWLWALTYASRPAPCGEPAAAQLAADRCLLQHPAGPGSLTTALAAFTSVVLGPARAEQPDPLAEIERLEALQRELLERLDARLGGEQAQPAATPAPAAAAPADPAQRGARPALRGRLVYASMRRLYMLELPDLTPRELDIGGARAFDPSFSPDGRRIAFGNVDLHIHDLDSGRTRHLIDGALHARFHPSRPWLVYGTSGRGLFVHDIEQDRIAQLLGPELAPFQPAWSPNARDVVFVGTPPGEANRYLFFVSTNCLGEPACVPQVRRLVTSGRMNHEPTWSPNARWIAFTRIEHNEDTWGVYVLEFETGRYRRISPPGIHDISPMWLPDSEHLIVVRHDDPLRSGMRNLYLIDREGRTLKRLTRDGAGLASFHPEPTLR